MFWNIIKINILFCVIRKIVFIFAAGNDKSQITMSEINQTINLHVTVDCVLIGFDGEQFRVLLVRQVGKQSEDGYNNMKLPGSKDKYYFSNYTKQYIYFYYVPKHYFSI